MSSCCVLVFCRELKEYFNLRALDFISINNITNNSAKKHHCNVLSSLSL